MPASRDRTWIEVWILNDAQPVAERIPDRRDNSKVIHVDDCILFATLFGKRQVFSRYRFSKSYAADAHFYEQAAGEYIVRKVNLRTYVYYRNIPGSTCSMLKQNTIAQYLQQQLS